MNRKYLAIGVLSVGALGLLYYINNSEPKIEPFDKDYVVEDHDDVFEIENKESGLRYVLSKKCPHRGCNVDYNAENNEFVCPCHQSKFNIEGKVLQGPATEDLDKINK